MRAHVNGVDLFYETRGTGIPFVLMHGGMGFDHTYFRPWLDPLSHRMKLIYYDHRGNGRSSPIADFAGIDAGVWADDADALRKYLGREKIVLLGHSGGAFVAQEYALRYGTHLAGLILCSAAPVIDYPDVIMANAQARATPEQLAVVMQLFTKPLVSDEQIRGDLTTILPLYFKHYDRQTGSRLVDEMHFSYQAFNHYAAHCLPAMNFLSRLKGIGVPTLLITGRADWVMPPAQGAERIHAGIPNSELVIFENSGHFPFVEERDLFVKTVRNWISRLKG
jgi:proline iminopeptidase